MLSLLIPDDDEDALRRAGPVVTQTLVALQAALRQRPCPRHVLSEAYREGLLRRLAGDEACAYPDIASATVRELMSRIPRTGTGVWVSAAAAGRGGRLTTYCGVQSAEVGQAADEFASAAIAVLDILRCCEPPVELFVPDVGVTVDSLSHRQTAMQRAGGPVVVCTSFPGLMHGGALLTRAEIWRCVRPVFARSTDRLASS